MPRLLVDRPLVLHAIESFGGGSYEVLRRVAWATAANYRVVVLHGQRPGGPTNPAGDFPPGTVFREWRVQREIGLREDLRALRTLSALVRHLRPALVHAHSSKAGALARLACLGTATPVIYSPHGYAFQRQDVGKGVRRVYRLVEFALGRLPYVTVACGPSELVQARSVARKVLEVPNGVDLASIDASAATSAPNDTPLVASAGRIAPQKDFELFASLSTDPRLSASSFVWFGGPDDGTCQGRVTISGWLAQADLYRRMSAADVFVQTSTWEGLPLVVLEAMALGLPVVARPIPGTSDLVRHGVTGFLCTDSAAFVTAIAQLVNDPVLRASMGREGRRLVEERYNSVDVASKWRDVYREYATS